MESIWKFQWNGNYQGNKNSFKKQSWMKKEGLCTFCKGNHLEVNCWNKNGYLPNFKSKFSKANSVMECEEVEVQDLIEQNYEFNDTINYGQNEGVNTTIPQTVFSNEQLA